MSSGSIEVSLDTLRARAALLQKLRRFMAERDVLEVETPYLSAASNPDPHIVNLQTQGLIDGKPTSLYLHSSPEFPMKRLLSSGSGCIYQIARVFRDGEQGTVHNPEFTMLEWYRVGFDHQQLMDEIQTLLTSLDFAECERIPYRECFLAILDVDPMRCMDRTLQQLASADGLNSPLADRNGLLDFLFSHRIAPQLGLERPCFVYDYPAEQAALARLRESADISVAERFELFINGMEIANGYHELNDAEVLRQRFEADIAICRARELAHGPIDENLIASTDNLPDCAGVALGVDRLLMTMLNIKQLDRVLCFPVTTA